MDDGTASKPKDKLSTLKKSWQHIFHKENREDELEEEIISMVNEGHEQGVLLASEAAMIHNIFEFGDKDAKDIMIHRKQIVALDGELSFGEAMDIMLEATYSRYPVYEQDLDAVIGVLHIKDALAFARNPDTYQQKIRDLEGLVHPVDFIPETYSLTTLFSKMQSKKMHLMIVVDEYGQTSGLVSLEDLLEEIVGNILDEHDQEATSIARIAPDYYRMTGATPLEEAAEVLGLIFPEEYETLNGFLIHMIDRIPEEHEQFEVTYEDYLFKVLDVESRRIKDVHVFHKKA
jgi:putative hemolysin